MAASTLLRRLSSCIGTAPSFRLSWAFLTSSRVKYLYRDFPPVPILHLSPALVTGTFSHVDLSTTVSSSPSSVRSYLDSFPCSPDVTKSMRLSAAKSRLSSLWYAPSALMCSGRLPVTSCDPTTPSWRKSRSVAVAGFTCTSVIRLGESTSSLVSVVFTLYPFTR